MLQRLSEQRKALSLYSVEHGGIVVLTKSELEAVDRICAILKPFYDATLEISRDDACISVRDSNRQSAARQTTSVI